MARYASPRSSTPIVWMPLAIAHGKWVGAPEHQSHPCSVSAWAVDACSLIQTPWGGGSAMNVRLLESYGGAPLMIAADVNLRQFRHGPSLGNVRSTEGTGGSSTRTGLDVQGIS